MFSTANPPGDGGSESRRSVGLAAASHRALVVAADRDTCAALQEILRDIAIEAFAAETVERARPLATRGVDIALIDMDLPGEAGDRFAAEVAEAGVVPVLMSAGAPGLGRAKRTGFLVLRKPFTLKEALRAIVLALPTR
jgi:DNA-binding response OmpR family regulator